MLKQTERMKQLAVKSLLRTLKHIDQERKRRTADLEDATEVVLKKLAEMGHTAVGQSAGKVKKTTASTVPTTKGKKRIRRSPEQLKHEALKVFAMIKKAGKDGMGGAEIRKSHPGVGQNIKAFAEKNAGVKVKTTGQKVKMRYFAG